MLALHFGHSLIIDVSGLASQFVDRCARTASLKSVDIFFARGLRRLLDLHRPTGLLVDENLDWGAIGAGIDFEADDWARLVGLPVDKEEALLSVDDASVWQACHRVG